MKFYSYDSADMFVNLDRLCPLSHNENPVFKVYFDLITKILLSDT